MTSKLAKFGRRFLLVALTVMFACGIASAFWRSKFLGTAVDAHLLNPSFENEQLPPGAWNARGANGWDLLPGTDAGIWHPAPGPFADNVSIDGDQLLYINEGGMSQTTHLKLGALTSYSFSVEWWNRMDWSITPPLLLQITAGDEVLATCSPATVPPKGGYATVTLTYYSDGSSPAAGKPISVRIVNGDRWLGQLDVDNAQLTYTDLSGVPASELTTKQECSVTVAN